MLILLEMWHSTYAHCMTVVIKYKTFISQWIFFLLA